jgi:hypothetical protein
MPLAWSNIPSGRFAPARRISQAARRLKTARTIPIIRTLHGRQIGQGAHSREETPGQRHGSQGVVEPMIDGFKLRRLRQPILPHNVRV